jgi:hypothetical protein
VQQRENVWSSSLLTSDSICSALAVLPVLTGPVGFFIPTPTE